MFLRNEVVLDGKVQKDVKVFDKIINFNISAITGEYTSPQNIKKNRYTFIRAVYEGDVTEEIKKIIVEGNFVRVYGRLDSEQYNSKAGKKVYNKILVINKATKLEYDRQTGIFMEVV